MLLLRAGINKGTLNHVCSIIIAPFVTFSILIFQQEHPPRGAFGQVAEFNDSCLHIVLYGKESPGSYLETNSEKTILRNKIKGKHSKSTKV